MLAQMSYMLLDQLRRGLLQKTEHGRLIVGVDQRLDDVQRALWAFAQTSAQPVAEALLHQPRFAVHHAQRALGARWNARAAAITLFFVDRDDLSFDLCHES